VAHEIGFGRFKIVFPEGFAHTSGDRRSWGVDDDVSHYKLKFAAPAPMSDDRYAKSQISPGDHFDPSIQAGLSLVISVRIPVVPLRYGIAGRPLSTGYVVAPLYSLAWKHLRVS
jgi:hypothetical protein